MTNFRSYNARVIEHTCDALNGHHEITFSSGLPRDTIMRVLGARYSVSDCTEIGSDIMLPLLEAFAWAKLALATPPVQTLPAEFEWQYQRARHPLHLPSDAPHAESEWENIPTAEFTSDNGGLFCNLARAASVADEIAVRGYSVNSQYAYRRIPNPRYANTQA